MTDNRGNSKPFVLTVGTEGWSGLSCSCRPTVQTYARDCLSLFARICISGLKDLSCYGFIKVFESKLLTETFRGSAQARPKQALHVTSIMLHQGINWLHMLQHTVYTVHNTLIGTSQEPISIYCSSAMWQDQW